MRKALSLAVVVGVAFAAREAQAQEPSGATPAGELPVRMVARPLTLPSMTLRGDAAFTIVRANFGGFGGTQTAVGLWFGGGFGVTDDFQIDATVVPLGLAPSPVTYGNPDIAATYRFVSGPVEVGGRFKVSIPVAGDRYLGLSPSVPVLIRLGDAARLDTGLNFTFSIPVDSGSGFVQRKTQVAWAGYTLSPYSIEAGLPLKLTFQVADPVFLGGKTGAGILLFEDAGQTFFIPLGVFGGATIPGDHGPIADITANFEFPYLFLPGARRDKVFEDLFYFGLAANVYVGL